MRYNLGFLCVSNHDVLLVYFLVHFVLYDIINFSEFYIGEGFWLGWEIPPLYETLIHVAQNYFSNGVLRYRLADA